MVPVMFTLYTIVERLDGASEIVRHGTYASRAEAEQIGENLRLLYGWVKSFEVRDDAAAGVRNQESGVRNQESGVRNQESGVRNQESGVRNQQKPEKKMTGSVRKAPIRKRKSS